MKIAQTNEGKSVRAAATAPQQAVCPCCGGVLILRSRRTMGDNTLTYYWRHRSNRNTKCTARRRPVN